jgi:predicted RNA binding protein YcfA (HicA-like mRNA interferase family)
VSPRLPVVSGSEAIVALGKAGFARVSQRGSHVMLRNEAGRTAIVPLHRELAPGTLRSVLRQAGLSVDEFVKLI